ncbi:MAG: glycosyltransferase [Opitutae bacterium]|nr:glycosyltransferase [Opitutae bacterium]
MPAPLVSVVLVCRNPGARVREALESVWAQPETDCEVVVIDGASTDGTREWLEVQRTRLGALISEPDRGVYDAMNKGIVAARGEWIIFLGADDRLASGDVLVCATKFLKGTDAGVVVGDARFDDGRIYRLAPASDVVRRNFVHHQAAFYRRHLLAGPGRFDAALRLQADYDVNLRLHRAGVRFAPLNLLIADCTSGGLSDAGRWANYREEITVRHRHFPAWQCWLWDLGSVARYLRKKIVRSRHG